MDINLYFYVEDLGLTATQRDTLVDELKTIGKRDQDKNPRHRNHWRVRSDNKAVIFEGWFDDAHLSAVGIRARLASIFGVNNTAINYATSQSAYGPYVTYSYNSVERVRVGVFGGPAAEYDESQGLALAYLAANQEAWEQEL